MHVPTPTLAFTSCRCRKQVVCSTNMDGSFFSSPSPLPSVSFLFQRCFGSVVCRLFHRIYQLQLLACLVPARHPAGLDMAARGQPQPSAAHGRVRLSLPA